MKRFNTNQVCNIRHQVNIQGTPATSVAKRLKASPSAVRRAASGQSYRDIPMPRPVPGFSNYLAYPDGRLWSMNRNQFIKPVQKGSSDTRYYNLRAGNNRKSIRSDELANLVF